MPTFTPTDTLPTHRPADISRLVITSRNSLRCLRPIRSCACTLSIGRVLIYHRQHLASEQRRQSRVCLRICGCVSKVYLCQRVCVCYSWSPPARTVSEGQPETRTYSLMIQWPSPQSVLNQATLPPGYSTSGLLSRFSILIVSIQPGPPYTPQSSQSIEPSSLSSINCRFMHGRSCETGIHTVQIACQSQIPALIFFYKSKTVACTTT